MSEYVVLSPSNHTVLPVTIPNMNDGNVVTKLFNKQMTGFLADLKKYFDRWDKDYLTESYIVTYTDEKSRTRYIEGYTCSDLKSEMVQIPDLSLCELYIKDCISGKTSLPESDKNPEYSLINLTTEFHSIINYIGLSVNKPSTPLTMDLLLERCMAQIFYSKYLKDIKHSQLVELSNAIKINIGLYHDRMVSVAGVDFVTTLEELQVNFVEFFTLDYCNDSKTQAYEGVFLEILQDLFTRAHNNTYHSTILIKAIKEMTMLTSIVIYNKINKPEQPFEQ